MTKHLHRCMKCGYSLESGEPGLCFPCFVADAKAKMSISSASEYGPRTIATKKTISKKGTPQSSENEKCGVNKIPKSKKASPKVHAAPEGWMPTRTAKSKKSSKQKKSTPNLHATPPGWRSIKNPGQKPTWVRCNLCGKGIGIAEGDMLAHIKMAHEVKSPAPLNSRSQGKNLWITFVQGGLPGLGKRR